MDKSHTPQGDRPEQAVPDNQAPQALIEPLRSRAHRLLHGLTPEQISLICSEIDMAIRGFADERREAPEAVDWFDGYRDIDWLHELLGFRELADAISVSSVEGYQACAAFALKKVEQVPTQSNSAQADMTFVGREASATSLPSNLARTAGVSFAESGASLSLAIAVSMAISGYPSDRNLVRHGARIQAHGIRPFSFPVSGKNKRLSDGVFRGFQKIGHVRSASWHSGSGRSDPKG